MKPIDPKFIESITKDRAVRRDVASKAHLMFFSIYFGHYIKYALADFHHEMFSITQDKDNKLACIVAFRGSGKSTIITLSCALWSILGVHQKKFVLLMSQTKHQAKQQMMNLRYELENNALLKSDLGPFQEETDAEWGSVSLVFKNVGARITIMSMEQSVRGIRHKEYRPDLIILDDIEDVASVKTQESRDKTFEWYTREVFPLGDLGTRIIIVGNFLHDDSLVARIRQKIESKTIEGVYLHVPLVKNRKCMWPGKFPDKESLATFRKSVMSDISWRREYLLQVVSDDRQIIKKSWIHTYKELPKKDYKATIAGVDLAISEKSTADYTAIVTGRVYGWGEKAFLYILPNPINVRCDFPTGVNLVKGIDSVMATHGGQKKIYTEKVGFQDALPQLLRTHGCFDVESVAPIGDKRMRLEIISSLIKDGRVLFPEKGCELLITQILGLGTEKHDDLCDACTLLIRMFVEVYAKQSNFVFA